MIGDVIFIRRKTLISWLIRHLTKSEWSHCGILMSNSGNYLIESDIFKPTSISKNNYTDYKVVHLNISDVERLSLVSFLIDRISTPYDYGRIFGIFLKIIGLTKRVDLWNDVNKDICSELVIRGLTSLNDVINISPDLVNAITPADVANILLKKEVINQI